MVCDILSQRHSFKSDKSLFFSDGILKMSVVTKPTSNSHAEKLKMCAVGKTKENKKRSYLFSSYKILIKKVKTKEHIYICVQILEIQHRIKKSETFHF